MAHRNPSEDFPDGLRRALVQQAEGARKAYEEFASSIQASQDAIKGMGALGLDPSTLKALTPPAPPPEMRQFGRLLAERLEESREAQRQMTASILAAHDSLTRMGGFGLHPSTLKALTLPDLSASFSNLTGLHEVMRASMPNIGATLARALEVPLFLRDFKGPTPEQMRKRLQRFVRAAEALAKAGWTFPMELAPSEVVELADEYARDSRELDQWFVDYYTQESGREFRALTTRLLKNKRLANWRPLLRECLCSYGHGLYRVVVPTLLAVIEGLVCEIAGTIRGTDTKPAVSWQKRTMRPVQGDILESQWCATLAFLEGLWRSHRFDRPAPGKLNRHLVVHGRQPHVGDRADALRLLAAVDFIADATCNVEGLAKRIRRKRRKGAGRKRA